ncbi:iron-containing alcohol dehydrogenase [Rhizobium sp. NPDC090275]|uniref:iron-containing alcohol dehydrogenase n=1 Tax=Rhizobium sp. NPDC090275 TaxID=3364498 RepID=UPI00383A6C48
MDAFSFDTTRSIVYGIDSIDQLAERCKHSLGKRIFVVTDPGIVKAGLIANPLARLDEAGISTFIFDRVTADPPEVIIEHAVEEACRFGTTGIVGIGGGSSLDVAKLVALIAGSGERLQEIYGIGKAQGPRLPLALVPTTAGTGSEVTPIAIVTTGAHEKQGVVSNLLIPDFAILDPRLTIGLPPAVTAATGIDAMVHAIEAFTTRSRNANPISKALAKEALRLLGGNIKQAVLNGADVEARGAMLLGSLLAGQAFANSPVAAVHALAYPLGGHYGIPHGLSNALVLTEVMRFNLPYCGKEYAELAHCLFADMAVSSSTDRAEEMINRLAALCQQLGLPTKLSEVGVAEDKLGTLATDAMKQQRLLVNNPREVRFEDAFAIYQAAHSISAASRNR